MRRAFLLLIGMAACSAPPGPAAADRGAPRGSAEAIAEPISYAIRLSRRPVVGRRFRVSMREREATTKLSFVDGEVLKDERSDRVVSLTGHFATRQVNDSGDAVHVEYQVDKLAVEEAGGSRRALIDARRIIDVRRAPNEEDGSIRARSGRLDEAQLEALELLISTRISASDDDEVFGVAEPQVLGAWWPISPERVRSSLAREGAPFELDAIGGRMTLAGMGEIAGQRCLQIEGGFEGRVRSIEGLPAELQVVRGEIKTTLWGMYPLDPELPPLESRSEVRMLVVAQGEVEGRLVEVRVEALHDTVSSLSPAPGP